MEDIVFGIFAEAGESLQIAEVVMLWLALMPAMVGVLFAMMSEWDWDCQWEDVQAVGWEPEFEECLVVSDTAIMLASWGDSYDNNPSGGLWERLWDDSDRWLDKGQMVELVI